MAEGRRSLQDFEAEQDEALGELSDAVGRLHAMGLNINEELESQNALLDDVEVRAAARARAPLLDRARTRGPPDRPPDRGAL